MIGGKFISIVKLPSGELRLYFMKVDYHNIRIYITNSGINTEHIK